MKKLLSFVLVLVMVMSLGATVFAADGDVDNGKITITNATVGETYTIWQILDLESYNKESNAYSYKSTALWKSFVEGSSVKDIYLITDDKGYVTWNSENKTASDVAAFAKLAKEYATKNNIGNQGQVEAESETVVFEGLDLGYYLVDTTLGTLCSLDTADNEVVMEDKNAKPVLVKKVQEDSNGHWQDANDADIGQTITFYSNIVAQEGAYNYVLHDKMSAGLTFKDVSKVTIRRANSTVETELVNTKTETYYTVVKTGISDGCTFHVTFSQELLLDTLVDTDEIIVYYTAELNESAVIGEAGNANEAWLSYGNASETTHDTTNTKTWELNIFKFTSKGNQNVPLAGAKFVLKTVFHEGDPTQYAIIKDGKITGWTMNIDYPDPNKEDIILDKNNNHILDTKEDGEVTGDPVFATILTSPADGIIEIIGLDGFTTYNLEEIEAPAGYNKLANDVVITIQQDGSLTTSTDVTFTGNTVNIKNNAGTELPETGGIGTTIFYIVGGIMVLAAVVFLITKKRMNSIE